MSAEIHETRKHLREGLVASLGSIPFLKSVFLGASFLKAHSCRGNHQKQPEMSYLGGIIQGQDVGSTITVGRGRSYYETVALPLSYIGVR